MENHQDRIEFSQVRIDKRERKSERCEGMGETIKLRLTNDGESFSSELTSEFDSVHINGSLRDCVYTNARERGSVRAFLRKIGKRKVNSQALAAGDWLVTGPPILPTIEEVTKICFFP